MVFNYVCPVVWLLKGEGLYGKATWDSCSRSHLASCTLGVEMMTKLFCLNYVAFKHKTDHNNVNGA